MRLSGLGVSNDGSLVKVKVLKMGGMDGGVRKVGGWGVLVGYKMLMRKMVGG